MSYFSAKAIQEGYDKAMQFYKNCVIPDRTPVCFGDKVIGATVGENNCKSPIIVELHPFEVAVNFNSQSYQDNATIEVTSLTIGDESEFEVKL